MADSADDGGGGLGVVLGVSAVVGLGIYFFTRRAAAPTGRSPAGIDGSDAGRPQVSVQPPTVETWRSYVQKLSPAVGLGPEAEAFIMNYLTMESGGRPCAVGFPGELDAQGQALESGLGQFMSPHDIKLAGTTVAEMRAACSAHVAFPGLTRSSPQAEIDAARAIAEKQVRDLTEDEKTRQVMALLTFLSNIRAIVDRSFAENGVTWPKTSADYWAMIKGYHAGQSFPTTGLALAKKALGAAPKNWGEFVRGYLSTVKDPNTHARHAHALDNARRAGAGSGLPWLSGSAPKVSGYVEHSGRGSYGRPGYRRSGRGIYRSAA